MNDSIAIPTPAILFLGLYLVSVFFVMRIVWPHLKSKYEELRRDILNSASSLQYLDSLDKLKQQYSSQKECVEIVEHAVDFYIAEIERQVRMKVAMMFFLFSFGWPYYFIKQIKS